MLHDVLFPSEGTEEGGRMTLTRHDSEITRRVRVVEFRPRPSKDPTSEPRVLVRPELDPPSADPRREDEVTRPIRRG